MYGSKSKIGEKINMQQTEKRITNSTIKYFLSILLCKYKIEEKLDFHICKSMG